MEITNQHPDDPVKPDEDVKFEVEKESLMGSHSAKEEEQPQHSIEENAIPAKEDTLGNSDFPPLSEKDKQPKLQDEERIKEMNRKTSLGD